MQRLKIVSSYTVLSPVDLGGGGSRSYLPPCGESSGHAGESVGGVEDHGGHGPQLRENTPRL